VVADRGCLQGVPRQFAAAPVSLFTRFVLFLVAFQILGPCGMIRPASKFENQSAINQAIQEGLLQRRAPSAADATATPKKASIP
jgi:hypothetical protein